MVTTTRETESQATSTLTAKNREFFANLNASNQDSVSIFKDGLNQNTQTLPSLAPKQSYLGLAKSGEVFEIPIDLIVPMPNQPRTFFDSKTLDELAASIQSYGIISPLLVTQMDQGNYCLIAGERRWRAAKLVGLKSAPCIIRNPNEHQNLEISLIENIQREDLNCFEEAECYFRLIDQHGFSHEALSLKLGKSRSQISNALRLLLLPLTIKNAVINNEISPGHARCLCGLVSEIEQIQLKNLIISKKLSVRQTEDLVKKRKKESETSTQKLPSTKTSESVRYVSEQLKSYLGTKVKILGDSEKGRIEISYYTLEDFQRIYELVVREQR